MSRLSSSERRALPLSDFGIPSQREYPMEDRAHAALAKSFAKKALDAGHISQNTYNEIVAHANRVLGQG